MCQASTGSLYYFLQLHVIYDYVKIKSLISTATHKHYIFPWEFFDVSQHKKYKKVCKHMSQVN